MESGQKLITIFGGTGNQGGGLAKSLLLNKKQQFKVRIITRDPKSAKSQQFAKIGAELVEADGFHKAKLVEAFRGSWGAFVNTNSNDEALNKPGAPNDYDLGASVIDAAEEAGVKHVVYSSGPSVIEMTHGRVFIPGFETKYHVDMRGRKKGFETFVPIVGACFMENLLDDHFTLPLGGFPWVPQRDGSYLLRAPLYGGNEDMPWVSVEDDWGDIVHGIFLDPHKHDRKLLQGTSQMPSFPEIVDAFVEVTGEKARYEQMTSWMDIEPDGSLCREELRGMFCYTQYNGGRMFGDQENDVSVASALKKAAKEAQGRGHEGNLMTIKEWLRREWVRQGRTLPGAKNSNGVNGANGHH